MLKLKSGRIVFFEGIVGMQMEGQTLVIELATKEKIELAGVSVEDMLQRRSDYYAEISATGAVTANFGNKVYLKLEDELEQSIRTLQTATIAYNSSAELANKASEVMVNTSNKVDAKAGRLFHKSEGIANNAASSFQASIEDTVKNSVIKSATKLAVIANTLEDEMKYLG